MKVERSYKFTFSKEEFKAIDRIWEFMSDMKDDEYKALLKQAGVKDFFNDLERLLFFAEDNVEG